ncbi:hypothetical protein F0562_033174 [Nyssa sinensis]|uniref:Uncharacterized protein n=1 Tax=Nyssa sinensis TaxID=561372 RepID=A0A5J5AUA6_9ASTE|nr:hypothetical protein F0562_033174 [Nyssa sinensis]
MGSCVSMHQNSESTVKVRWWFGSKTGTVLTESTIKEIAVNSEQFKLQQSSMPNATTFRDSRSKEEMFFDSHPWLESDSEDFFSVNGDFTPSRGNTPIHQSSLVQTPQLDKSFSIDKTHNSVPEPSPTDTKKKLIELFHESFGGNQIDVDQNFQVADTVMANGKLRTNPTILDLSPKSTNATPYVSAANSVCSSEMTPNTASKSSKGKLSRSVSCCLPSLARSMSLSERKRNLSPAHIGGRWNLVADAEKEE